MYIKQKNGQGQPAFFPLYHLNLCGYDNFVLSCEEGIMIEGLELCISFVLTVNSTSPLSSLLVAGFYSMCVRGEFRDWGWAT